jgi:hypothetical protein
MGAPSVGLGNDLRCKEKKRYDARFFFLMPNEEDHRA